MGTPKGKSPKGVEQKVEEELDRIKTDEYYMKEALKEAKKAYKKEEIPVRSCNCKKWRNNCKGI